MEGLREMSAAEAELDRNEVVRICLRCMVAAGGSATTAELYAAVEASMGGSRLSPNGRACVREYVNRYAVRTGLVLPHSPDRPGWHITAEGRESVVAEQGVLGPAPAPSSPMSRAFEQYVLRLMHLMHPRYFWYHQGVHTRHERGLDLIGTRFPEKTAGARSPDKVGVQVKLHDPTRAPSDEEWRKFLAGCFTRRVDLGIFVTTGCLTGEQRREASEAGVIVIAGAEEIARVADQYGYAWFEAEASTSGTASQPTPRAATSATLIRARGATARVARERPVRIISSTKAAARSDGRRSGAGPGMARPGSPPWRCMAPPGTANRRATSTASGRATQQCWKCQALTMRR